MLAGAISTRRRNSVASVQTQEGRKRTGIRQQFAAAAEEASEKPEPTTGQRAMKHA